MVFEEGELSWKGERLGNDSLNENTEESNLGNWCAMAVLSKERRMPCAPALQARATCEWGDHLYYTCVDVQVKISLSFTFWFEWGFFSSDNVISIGILTVCMFRFSYGEGRPLHEPFKELRQVLNALIKWIHIATYHLCKCYRLSQSKESYSYQRDENSLQSGI